MNIALDRYAIKLGANKDSVHTCTGELGNDRSNIFCR